MTESAAVATLEPGTRIDDRYRIVGQLGAGGMGVVYRARDERLGRQVALKTLPPERVGDAQARARLIREARAAAAIEHPGIAQVYDVGETEDGGAYLVMELVRGQSLRVLMRSSAIDRDELLDVLEQIARALDHAHAQGVIHRDIKPDNVMVRDDGRAVLLDFGLAKDVGPSTAVTLPPDTPSSEREALTLEGALIGTLSYLAPEQARGRDVGPRSDQFALATTAYEALVGRLPWVGGNMAAVLAQILVDEPPPPSSVESTLPASVDRVFARALAKEPEERFESASAFVSALRDAFLESVKPAPQRKEEPSPARESKAPVTRKKGVPRIVATLLVGVGAAVIAWLVWLRTGPSAALGETAVIGCPVLEASGVPQPNGWLGAMASDLACRRLSWHLGGDSARTRAPAELAGLHRVAGDGFPADPWIAPDARTRTLAAARRLDGWIDGRVRLVDGEARVTLRMYARGEPEPIAHAEGRGGALYVAVGAALDRLLAADVVPTQERVPRSRAQWLGIERTETAIAFDDLLEASLTGFGAEERCRALIARGREIRWIAGEVQRQCMAWTPEEARRLRPPALDTTTSARLALTAPEHAQDLPRRQLHELADRLASARREQRNAFARASLAKAEIQLREQLNELDQAVDLMLIAADDMPRDWFLRMHYVRAMRHTTGQEIAVRALAAWRPGTPEAWRALALPEMNRPEVALPWLRRAYESGGTLPLHGIQLADALLRLGRTNEVRAISARYSSGGPSTRLAGEYLRSTIDIREAHFGRAYERMGAALRVLPRLGHLLDGDLDCLRWYLELAEVLGRREEAADALVRRFVLAEPHRLVIDQPHYELPAIDLCLHASRDVARPCLARLRQLRSGPAARAGRLDGAEALLSGAERYAAGDDRGAVDAWRPLVMRRSPFIPPEVFDRVGEHDLAERLDRFYVRRDQLAGANLAHVRVARRAHAAGDGPRTREMAELVIRSWSRADVPVPAVAEMRTLLAEPDR